jgi:hypothetical protein
VAVGIIEKYKNYSSIFPAAGLFEAKYQGFPLPEALNQACPALVNKICGPAYKNEKGAK